tara:strand:+ start:2755 stop:4092 length:1338 start_codon:yes stop_codon:yes gene_type:complete
MRKKAILFLSLSLVLFLVSCEYFVLPGINETICEPPNQLVQDVDGNLVCLTVDSTEGLEEKVDKALEEPTEEVKEEVKEEPTVEVTESVTEEVTEEIKEDVVEVKQESVGTVTELPRKIVTEGDFVNFPNLRAVDPDGDAITYTFSEPLNDQGEWKTQVGDAAEYKITISASDGENEVTQDVILVVLSKNKAPSISLSDSIIVDEGQTVVLEPKVSDPEGEEVSVSYSGWMTSASKQTGFNDAGTFSVTVTASDGIMTSTADVSVVVNNVNRKPVLEGVNDVEIIEGEEVSFAAKASDPDGDELSLSFSTPFNEEGVWQTKEGDAGTYTVKVVVSDGSTEISKDVEVKVNPKNLPPELSVPESITVREGEKIVIEASAKDPEGENVIITYSGFMRTNTLQTEYDDAGTHKVTVTADDGANQVEKEISIVIEDVNRPPSFDPGAFN